MFTCSQGVISTFLSKGSSVTVAIVRDLVSCNRRWSAVFIFTHTWVKGILDKTYDSDTGNLNHSNQSLLSTNPLLLYRGFEGESRSAGAFRYDGSYGTQHTTLPTRAKCLVEIIVSSTVQGPSHRLLAFAEYTRAGRVRKAGGGGGGSKT